MEEEYRGRTAKFTKRGEVYYAVFDDDDVSKNIYGDTKSDKKGWKAKINLGADGDIFDLVENSAYDRSKEEIGKSNEAHKDVLSWDYYVKTVQIDGYVFDIVANVRLTAKDEFVYNIQLNESKRKSPSPLHRSADNGRPLKSSAQRASTTNYAQKSENVNSLNKKKNLTQVNPQLHKWLTIINERSFDNSISNSSGNVNSSNKKSDLSQVNPKLYKWLATINDKTLSNNNISENSKKVNTSEEKTVLP